MPKFQLEVPHTFTAEEAKSRLERFVDSLQAQYGDKVSELEQAWNGNKLTFGFKTFGFKIAGAIEALEQKLLVTGEIPFTAMMFKGKIESEVKEKLARLMRA